MDLTIKGFLAVRRYWQHIFNVIILMTASSLKCFRKKSMETLVERFALDLNDIQAAHYMRNIIYDAYNKLTTRLYDDIQYMQNRIHR